MLSFRTIFRSLALGAALTGLFATPAVSNAAAIFVSIAPPIAPVYAQPPIPAYGYVWVNGYWAWGDEGYYWVPGYWTLPPYEGAVWQPGIWAYGGGGWGWTVGFWGHPAGYFGGVYYARPWPWIGGFGVVHEGFYRNSFYDRGFYNGFYNQHWGLAHGRAFDDRRWNEARTTEARWNGNVQHGAFRDQGFSGRRTTDDHAFNAAQRGNVDRNVRTDNRSFNQRPAATNNGVNRGQTFGNQRQSTAQVTSHQVYNGNRTPQAYNGGNYRATQSSAQQRNSAPQQQRYSAPQQHNSAPAQHNSAPQSRGGEQHSNGGGHGHR
jgi:WXXGXW repeat (2 copies)